MQRYDSAMYVVADSSCSCFGYDGSEFDRVLYGFGEFCVCFCVQFCVFRFGACVRAGNSFVR